MLYFYSSFYSFQKIIVNLIPKFPIQVIIYIWNIFGSINKAHTEEALLVYQIMSRRLCHFLLHLGLLPAGFPGVSQQANPPVPETPQIQPCMTPLYMNSPVSANVTLSI